MSNEMLHRVRYCSAARGTALTVALLLADLADDDGTCFPGMAFLAASARVSERRARNAVAELRRIGEVEVRRRGCGVGGIGRPSVLCLRLPAVERDESGKPRFRSPATGSEASATGRARPVDEARHRTRPVALPDDSGRATGRARPPTPHDPSLPPTPKPLRGGGGSDAARRRIVATLTDRGIRGPNAERAATLLDDDEALAGEVLRHADAERWPAGLIVMRIGDAKWLGSLRDVLRAVAADRVGVDARSRARRDEARASAMGRGAQDCAECRGSGIEKRGDSTVSCRPCNGAGWVEPPRPIAADAARPARDRDAGRAAP